MALFNRRKNQTITELESYYAGKKNQNLKAWIMALLSLLVTVAVIAALFFGGRWIYRALTDDSSDTNTTNSDTTEQAENANNGGGSLTISNADESDSTTESSEEFPEVVTDEAASTDVPSSSRAVASNSTSVAKGSDLPNTGSGDILVVVPMITFIGGYFISRKHQLNK